ncbi:MAG: hypothetical protein Q7S29_01120 [Candidatus Peribacter sp.]|nr:hypothetical protein [Candidatus Peribacter sp.]
MPLRILGPPVRLALGDPNLIEFLRDPPCALILKNEPLENLLHDFPFRGNQLQLFPLFWIRHIKETKRNRPARIVPSPSGSLAPLLGTHADILTLELRQSPEYLEYELPDGSREVQILLHGGKPHVIAIHRLKELQEVREVPGETVNLPYQYKVNLPLLHELHELMQLWATLNLPAGAHIEEMPLGVRVPPFVLLALHVLGKLLQLEFWTVALQYLFCSGDSHVEGHANAFFR